MDPVAAAPDASSRRRELQASLIRGLLGKKVVVSTRDGHFVLGRLTTTDEALLALTVNGRVVQVAHAAVVRIQEADVAQAEYVK